ncbi:hypothetical protein KNP414_05920 [Paenibacillus mucilaginosus KNP414]|uniref:Uncharacterized protein n=1 Tax=Paenibacillus mucilaginosus (strain KNP414) TaxID=1036673 RepID=F8FC43_PAEMK|nr:hypothetical protein KNP414_05920 [Paenibacillus mucilaginosus KNP414]
MRPRSGNGPPWDQPALNLPADAWQQEPVLLLTMPHLSAAVRPRCRPRPSFLYRARGQLGSCASGLPGKGRFIWRPQAAP